jgi:hypothetical protein
MNLGGLFTGRCGFEIGNAVMPVIAEHLFYCILEDHK